MNNPSVFMETIQSIGQDSKFAVFANANLHEQVEAVSQAMKGLNESLAYAVYTQQMEDMIDRFNKEVSEKDITKMQELLSKMKIYDGPITGTYNVDFMYAVFFYQHLVDTHYFDKVNVDGKVTEALISRAIVDQGRKITWIDPDAPTGTNTISAIAQGFSLSMAHSASDLSAMFPWDPYFYTETVPGLIQFGKMVKDGEFKELGNALAEEYIQPLKEVERMADKVLSGKATYEEAHQFGQNLAKVLEGVAAIGTGATAALKAVKTLKSLFRKGTGEGNLYDKDGKYTGGRNQEELDDLARDPASGGKIEPKNVREREVGLAVEERGDLGRLIRDPQAESGAEFIDTTSGLKWDVKSFESYPSGDNGVPITNPKKGAFTIQQGIKKLQKEFDNGNNVIIDTRKMEPEHIEQLKKAIDEAGVAYGIIWYP